MKHKKLKFLLFIASVYLIILVMIIFVYNPDFANIKNWLLFIPLYIPLFISSYIRHKTDDSASKQVWEFKVSLIFVTLVVALSKIIADTLL